MVKEMYLICQCVNTINNGVIEQRITPVDEYPYVLSKDDVLEILEKTIQCYIALPVLIKMPK